MSGKHPYEPKVLIHKALSDPVRLQIVRTLFQNCEMNLRELGQELDLSAAPLSRHLRNLEAAGILTSRHKENFIYYHLQKF